MADRGTRVVLLGLDGFPASVIGPELTPRLWALGEAGGRAPQGGVCALPSTTYPGFATLLTGRLPERHGVRATVTSGPVAGVIPGWAGRRRVDAPTLFDACRAAGLRSASVQGDHKLHEILATESADLIWPPGGVVPPGTPLDSHGYPTNQALRPHLLDATRDRSLGFLFGHVNEADSVGHERGPDHPESRACYAATDALVGEVADALRDDWERAVLVVTSDHAMEPFTAAPPVDLLADGRVREAADDLLSQGASALVHPREGVSARDLGAALMAVPGVARWSEAGPRLAIVEAEPGRVFWHAGGRIPAVGGHHGGPDTAHTVAVVAGGHPAVPAIAASIRARRPHLADWAPTVAALLGLDLADVDGRDLAAA